MEQKFERPPTAEEIANLIELSITEVEQSLKNTGRHISMDAPLIEGEDSSLYDVMGSEDSPNPDASLMLESLREEIRRALETLTPREADVVSSYFGLAGRSYCYMITYDMSSVSRLPNIFPVNYFVKGFTPPFFFC